MSLSTAIIIQRRKDGGGRGVLVSEGKTIRYLGVTVWIGRREAFRFDGRGNQADEGVGWMDKCISRLKLLRWLKVEIIALDEG